MIDKEKWCEHIHSDYDDKVLSFKGIHVGHPKQVGAWNYCPICGTPRPTQEKKECYCAKDGSYTCGNCEYYGKKPEGKKENVDTTKTIEELAEALREDTNLTNCDAIAKILVETFVTK